MDDGLQLNFVTDEPAGGRQQQLGWRDRKRQARQRQSQKAQRQRGSQQGRANGRGGGGGSGAGGMRGPAPAAAAAAAAASRPPGAGARQPKPGQAAGGSRLSKAQPDAMHGYGAALAAGDAQQQPLQQQQQQQPSSKQQQQQSKQQQQQQPSQAQQRAGSRPAAAAGGQPAAGGGAAKRRKLEQLESEAAAAEAMTAAEADDIMALVQLNLSHDERIQAALQQMQTQQQQRQRGRGSDSDSDDGDDDGAAEASQGRVVEFGDAPDEPDLLEALNNKHGRGQQQQQQHKQGAGKKGGAGAAAAMQQQQQLAQHKVGEMAHAEPDVPAASRLQLFGDAGGGGEGCHSWGGLGLCQQLADHLEALNFQEPTQVQQRSIPVLLSGRDALVRSPTGSGKTLAYLAPIVQTLQAQQPRINRSEGAYALVLVPTRELAVQVSDVLTALIRRFCWLVPGLLIGGEHRGHEKARLRKGVTVLVATPGRLLDHLQNTASFKAGRLRWLVLDEADRLLDLGFEAKLASIVQQLDERAAAEPADDDNSYAPAAAGGARRQSVLLSATLHPGLSALAGLSMRDPVGVGFTAQLVGGKLQLQEQPSGVDGGGDAAAAEASNAAAAAAAGGGDAGGEGGGVFELPQQLSQRFLEVPAKMRLVALVGLLRSRLRRSKAAKLVVFFSNCDSVNFHHQLLQRAPDGADDAGAESQALLGGCPVLRLHGDMRQPERTSSLVTFAKASSCVLLCTDVAARGLDFPGVTTILQYDPAGEPAEYVHRVGRTARMGQQGEALLFLLPSEAPYVQLLQQRGVALSREPPATALQCLPALLAPGGSGASIAKAARRLHTSAGDAGGGAGGGDWEAGGVVAAEQLAAAQLLQRQLVALVSGDADLNRLALNAYRSFVRAYATHPSALKHVFHVKSLHLGHVASCFGLREAPGRIGAKGAAAERRKRKADSQQAAVKREKAAWHKKAKAAVADDG